jgi:hypothetical protein
VDWAASLSLQTTPVCVLQISKQHKLVGRVPQVHIRVKGLNRAIRATLEGKNKGNLAFYLWVESDLTQLYITLWEGEH